MDRLLRMGFEKLIRVGNLQVSTAGGSTFTFGDGTGRPVAIRFTTRAAEGRVLIDPELRFGEAYMDGGVVVEQGSIADFACAPDCNTPHTKQELVEHIELMAKNQDLCLTPCAAPQ